MDKKKENRYYIAIHVSEVETGELRLISVENLETRTFFAINAKPKNKEQKYRRKEMIKNFEFELDNLGLKYEHLKI